MDSSSAPHPARLPLGAAWMGKCSVSARIPSESDLGHCNLGYSKCNTLPLDRSADAIRFAVANASEGRVTLRYACELDHRPVDCGTLTFDRHQSTWATKHPDPRVQRMAECYVEAFLSR